MGNLDKTVYENQLAPIFLNLQGRVDDLLDLVSAQIKRALEGKGLKTEDRSLLEFAQAELARPNFGRLLTEAGKALFADRMSQRGPLYDIAERLEKLQDDTSQKVYTCAAWGVLSGQE